MAAIMPESLEMFVRHGHILGGDQYGSGKVEHSNRQKRVFRFAFFDQPVHEGCHVVVCMFPRVGIRLPSGRIVHGPAALSRSWSITGR